MGGHLTKDILLEQGVPQDGVRTLGVGLLGGPLYINNIYSWILKHI